MSIVHLAQDLGLSVSTVSRALNGYTDVAESTRLRVMERAQALGYKPHPGARRLKSGKSGAVGVVLPTSPEGGQFIDSMYSSLLGGTSSILEPAGYSLMATTSATSTPEQERAVYENFIRSGWFDAFVIVRTRLVDQRVELMLAHQKPFVTYGRCADSLDHAWVDTDNEMAFFMAAQRQIQLGHQRIALLNGPAEYTFAQLRQQGYLNALTQANLKVDERLIVQGHLSETGGFSMAQQLMALENRPTALLCATDAMAIGAMAACRAIGLRVGSDISVMGYGNSDAGRYCNPPLSTIEHRIFENGQHLGQVLLSVLAGDSSKSMHYLEPVVLVPRSSDAPVAC
ncbi:LacI family DNA-binding transcriptional regulator [Limnohabitans sp.]|uniref:LacI family DNA-binding transcriptional regulator n=1 Tax=Limnohabitans sp. TaxID=1907725 RepID=UPI002AFDEEE3|nr:LacI family DNA-binding transcriptional regulator [Limnohabitans sp.]